MTSFEQLRDENEMIKKELKQIRLEFRSEINCKVEEVKTEINMFKIELNNKVEKTEANLNNLNNKKN